MISPLEIYEQTITVATRFIASYDKLRCPVYAWKEEKVDGCLCAPQEPTDLPTGKWTNVRQDGNQAKYYVYIPKSCNVNFENARVKIGGEWYWTIGIPQPYLKSPANCKWNQYVICERETG